MNTPLILHGTTAVLSTGDTLLRGRDSNRRVHAFNDHIYAIRPDRWNPNSTPEGMEGMEFAPHIIWELLMGWAAMSADVWCDEPEHYEEGNGHYDDLIEYAYEHPCMHIYAIMPENLETESENLTRETGDESVKYDCNAKVLFEVTSQKQLTDLCRDAGLMSPFRAA